MINPNAFGANRSRVAWWKRTFWSLGAVTGLFGASFGAKTPAAAQNVEYRAVSVAPASWQEFAKQVQIRFQQRFAADDEGAAKFRDYLTKRASDGNAKALKPAVRVWVLPNGKVERLEFDGLDDDDVAVNLRAVLMRGGVGTPPPDMLQPLHLRLSLQ